MERLLLARSTDNDRDEPINPEGLLNHIQLYTLCNPYVTSRDNSPVNMLQKCVIYEDMVHSGHLGKIARFWL